MLIGVDLDNCVFDYDSALVADIARQLGVTDLEAHRALYPPPVDWEMSNWPDFPERFREFHLTAVDNHMYRDMPVKDGASEILWRLSEEGHRIRVITSRFVGPGRNSLVITDTGLSLDKNNIPFHEIAFSNRKQDFICDVLIDDSPKNIAALREVEREVIIFDASYNRTIEGRRAKDWNEVYEHIQELDKAA